jgi:hypothetical protein
VAKPRQRVGFLEDPRQLTTGGGNPVQHEGAPQILPGTHVRDGIRGGSPQLLRQQRVDILRENATGRQLLAVSGFRQKRLAPETVRRERDRVFEREVLECVQRVVVDEDADRALGRQEAGEPIDELRERTRG